MKMTPCRRPETTHYHAKLGPVDYRMRARYLGAGDGWQVIIDRDTGKRRRVLLFWSLLLKLGITVAGLLVLHG